MLKARDVSILIASLVLLQSCASTPAKPSADTSATDSVSAPRIRGISDAEAYGGEQTEERRRLIADLLFDALQALDGDRLLTPVDDSAHGKFMRVLAYEPDNELALEGIQRIVRRYLDLSEEAMRRGLFEESETMLDRARFVDEEHPDITRVALALQAEKNSSDLFFSLDNVEFSSRSEAAQQQLREIAIQAKEAEAFFLITAPNDDLARWMYTVMREAVSGYRLRGNIELASRTSIRLRMPEE